MSNLLVRRSTVHALEFRDADADQVDGDSIGTLVGYIALFDVDSLDLGGYVERNKAGAFAESLKTRDVVALVNHEYSDVVGRLSSGTLALREDEKGLAFELSIPNTEVGRSLKILTRRGDLKGCSYGFTIGAESWTHEDDKDVCTVERIDLYEVSVGVTFPAYEATSMELRDRLTRRRERDRALYRARFDFLKHKTRYT